MKEYSELLIVMNLPKFLFIIFKKKKKIVKNK